MFDCNRSREGISSKHGLHQVAQKLRINNLLLKSKEFFKKLNIKNLKIFYDPSVDLAKKFKLRGIPTTVLINKDGKEFARVIGSIDFRDKQFIDWLKNYN